MARAGKHSWNTTKITTETIVSSVRITTSLLFSVGAGTLLRITWNTSWGMEYNGVLSNEVDRMLVGNRFIALRALLRVPLVRHGSESPVAKARYTGLYPSIQRIQRFTTRPIKGFCHLPCNERPRRLNVHPLCHQCLTGGGGSYRRIENYEKQA